MGRTKTGGQTARRSPKKTSRKRTASRKIPEKKLPAVDTAPLIADEQAQHPGEAAHDAVEKTRQQLHRLTEKLHEAAEKSIHAIKEVAADIQLYAKDTTELTKVRIDLNNAVKERQKLLMLMGEKLRNMHRANKLTRIPAKFADDFSKLDYLEDHIEEMKKTENALTAEIKNV